MANVIGADTKSRTACPHCGQDLKGPEARSYIYAGLDSSIRCLICEETSYVIPRDGAGRGTVFIIAGAVGLLIFLAPFVFTLIYTPWLIWVGASFAALAAGSYVGRVIVRRYDWQTGHVAKQVLSDAFMDFVDRK